MYYESYYLKSCTSAAIKTSSVNMKQILMLNQFFCVFVLCSSRWSNILTVLIFWCFWDNGSRAFNTLTRSIASCQLSLLATAKVSFSIFNPEYQTFIWPGSSKKNHHFLQCIIKIFYLKLLVFLKNDIFNFFEVWGCQFHFQKSETPLLLHKSTICKPFAIFDFMQASFQYFVPIRDWQGLHYFEYQ